MRKIGLPTAVLVIAVLAATLGGSAATARDAAPVRTAKVDPNLVQQLRANPSGVAAVVTTWNHEALDAVAAAGVTGVRLRTLPMILAPALTPEQLDRLAALDAVRSVWANERFRIQMEDSTWITRARYVWANSNGTSDLPGFNVTGRGVEIAVIDTGIDGKHEDTDNLVEYCETTLAVSGNRNLVACSPYNPASGNLGPAGLTGDARLDSTDDEGHGSHVSGTIAGAGHGSGGTQNTHSTIGMAPHAKLRVYSANVGPALLAFQILAAYDDMTYKKLKGLNNVVATSNSFGGGDGLNYDPDSPDNIAVKRAYDAGILSVYAAGNSGPEHNTLSRQCVNPWVVCVAASTKPDSVVMFSSRGRPSQPWDTNRDGAINSADVQPDNHDRRLGQALEIGLYRPTLTAPGVNINSISANSGTCREDVVMPVEPSKSGCYEPLNGTSMATPHVSGAVALIVQAYRLSHGGRTPTPGQIIDILERSSNVTKLPGWEAEEQGAGRLDAYTAVRFARTYPTGLRRPNLGHPTPPYLNGDYPKGPDGTDSTDYEQTGCTTALSWTYGDVELENPLQGTPIPSVGYGQHFIDVPNKTERLRITLRWQGPANLYARLWRPGVNPDADVNPPGRMRTFPDQEALGLLDGNVPYLGPDRLLEVRAPEEAVAGGPPPTIPSGKWVLRIYHRAGDFQLACAGDEDPKRTVNAKPYQLHVEMSRVTHEPTVSITSPAANASTNGRWVTVTGRAGYPPPDAAPVGYSWEGVTNWAPPGSEDAGASPEIPNPDTRSVLYFHGQPAHNGGEAWEADCTGDGRTDVVACAGPYLLPGEELALAPAASWKTTAADALVDGLADRNIYDPHWVWCLVPQPACTTTTITPTTPSNPTTVAGPMTVRWWAECVPCGPEAGYQMDWTIRLWADGVLRYSRRVSATPDESAVPARLTATVNVPRVTANRRFTLHIDPVPLGEPARANIYYDSQLPCPGATMEICDSLVRMPVVAVGEGEPTGPSNVRVTDLPANAPYPGAPQTPALRVAWDALEGASRYDVYRSTNPLMPGTLVHNGTGTMCTSPEAPAPGPADAPPGHDPPAGPCFTDMGQGPGAGLSLRTTYYYRVYGFIDGERTAASGIAYGTPTRYDRSVKLRVDRLYGTQYSEYALLGSSPNPTQDDSGTSWAFLWDTLELSPGLHDLFARSFTQGIGSTKATRTLRDDGGGGGGGGGGPGCPDDDDGDGDDDEEDGDSDDDGDDGDDDCEDDDDSEEDEDD